MLRNLLRVAAAAPSLRVAAAAPSLRVAAAAPSLRVAAAAPLLRVGAAALLLLGCAVLPACKGTEAASGRTGPDTCSSDPECGSGFKCDREQRHCVCTGDDACPGRFCNAFTGQCVDAVAGCTSDAACKAGEYCDRGLRSCKPLTAPCGACKTDAQCGPEARCAAMGAGTSCLPRCGVGGTCAPGSTCRARDTSAGADQLCFPSSGACGQGNACTPDSLAVCAVDADCADATQQCDAQLRACVARRRACPAGDACDPQQRVCRHACANDADCAAIEGQVGYQCRNNACYALATCVSDADCGRGLVCQPNADGSKSCKAGCVTSTDCPLGQGCNEDPQHPRCAAGCTQSLDCPLNAVCQAGACASSLASCAQTCQATAACALASACSSNGCCVAANLQQLCPPGCNPSSDANCVLVFPKGCAIQTDCADLPNTQCEAIGGGQFCMPVTSAGAIAGVRLLACAGDTDCPYKGFRCQAIGAGRLCFPSEQAAQRACVAGKP